VAEYQTVDGGDLGSTMKVVMTDMNYYTNTDVLFLVYFNTTFNSGVEPGDYLWAPGTGQSEIAQAAPFRSPQIFGDYLDTEGLESRIRKIDGTNLTYAEIGGTTIRNEAFGTLDGQRVEILLLLINSGIPTIVIGSDLVEEYAEPCADLAETIAGSRELLSVIEEFLEK